MPLWRIWVCAQPDHIICIYTMFHSDCNGLRATLIGLRTSYVQPLMLLKNQDVGESSQDVGRGVALHRRQDTHGARAHIHTTLFTPITLFLPFPWPYAHADAHARLCVHSVSVCRLWVSWSWVLGLVCGCGLFRSREENPTKETSLFLFALPPQKSGCKMRVENSGTD